MEWKLKYKIESESEVDKMNEDVKQKSESRSQMSKTNNEWGHKIMTWHWQEPWQTCDL